jgi:hypothetical protein
MTFLEELMSQYSCEFLLDILNTNPTLLPFFQHQASHYFAVWCVNYHLVNVYLESSRIAQPVAITQSVEYKLMQRMFELGADFSRTSSCYTIPFLHRWHNWFFDRCTQTLTKTPEVMELYQRRFDKIAVVNRHLSHFFCSYNLYCFHPFLSFS